MAHVVTSKCYDCRYTDCVVVCPVDCFYGDDKSLYIDPDECIDCAACVAECPVEAIFSEENVPSEYQEDINRNKTKVAELKLHSIGIKDKQKPLNGPACKKG